MKIRVSRANDSIVFEFDPPTGFGDLTISNADEVVQWELAPASMEPVTVLDAEFAGLAVASGDGLAETGPDRPSDCPIVDRVIYGLVPAGYREREPARPLQEGMTYAIIVLIGPFDHTGGYFVA